MRKRTFALGAAAVVALSVASAYAADEPAYTPPQPGSMPVEARSGVEIAPVEEALTFARYEEAGRTRVMRVDRYADGVVSGTALDALGDGDPITLYQRHGYNAIAQATGAAVRIPDGRLDVPFDGTASQIAIGGNYPAHNTETSLTESFLFPKLNEPGRFDAGVSAGDGLLDYEVELGFVTLEPVRADQRPSAIGLVLASDYTDRATLLREADLQDITSGKGFPNAKSKPGYMPIGNLFVIPADVRGFYRKLDLRLYVNGRLRQVAPPGKMIWDMDEIFRRSVAQDGRRWPYGSGDRALPIADRTIAPRTIILSGTTDGVVFRPPSTRQKMLGGLEVVLPPWSGVRQKLVEPAIREAKADRRFLQPGDEVVEHAHRLGVIRNRITS